LNHEWYEFLAGHEIVPVCCHGPVIDVAEYDLVILTGGNDMPDIRTWRNNHYPLRDHFEASVIKQCALTHTPLVGICRGQHFLNYVMGGTHCLMEQPYDNVKVQLPEFEVTCHHTIRIDQLAPGFAVLQQDSAGVPELVLHKANRQLGIGWHPERAVNAHTRSYVLDLIENL
jgi:gamma-glutamyl-gamma-aminobutyrate hydrolase PuuD